MPIWLVEKSDDLNFGSFYAELAKQPLCSIQRHGCDHLQQLFLEKMFN